MSPYHPLYCRECDLIYDEEVAACPTCDGEVEPWDDRYLEADPRKGSLREGALVTLGLHALQLIGLFGGVEVLIFAGFTQFLYVIPALIVFAVKGRTRSMGGVAMTAGITLFLNVAIFGLLCASLLSGGPWYD